MSSRSWRSRGGSATPRLAVAAVGVVGLAVATGTSYAHPQAASHGASETAGHSTLQQTIIGDDQRRVNDGRRSDDFEFLGLGEGEPHVVREALGQARPGRENRRRSLIYLAQLTDFQLADEQSPSRVEWLDRDPSGFARSAWRPQEALVPHQVEFTIRQVNEFLRSPVRQGNGNRARMANAVMTGDLADNAQRNETEWVVQLLEGGVFVNGQRVSDELEPDSGSRRHRDYDGQLGCPPRGPARNDLRDEASNYTGVQDYDDYPGKVGSPDYYDPDEPSGDFDGWPTYTGLMDKAQEPFEIEGLEVPSYVAFGNHDNLAQGNAAMIAPYERVGIGCHKIFPPVPPVGSLFDGDPERAFDQLERLANNLPLDGDLQTGLVPPDPERQYVDKAQFKNLHDTGAQRDAHGFALVDRDELQASNGAASYYSFRPPTRTGDVRYIVLDTVSEGGVVGDSSSGNIAEPQFQWLRGELQRAQRRNELIMVFGHHATGSLTSQTPDEAAPLCTTNDEHGHDTNPGCRRDTRPSTAPGSPSPRQGDDLENLFHRFPNVLAYAAGHSHENRVQPFPNPDGPGGFWEIKSPAVVDWPPQHRLIELMDNRDGTLSIFGTMLDDSSPVRAPGGDDPVPAGGVQAQEHVGDFSSAELSSLGRTISYNDPQVGPQGERGERPQGVLRDRNVELLIRDPRLARDDDRPRDGEPDGRRRPAGPRDGGAAGAARERGPVEASLGARGRAGDRGGRLPFTGLGLVLLGLVAAGLLAAGSTLRRGASGG